MPSDGLNWLTVHEAQALLRRGEVSSVELTRAVLERMSAVEGRVHAYLRVLADEALAQAEGADRRRAEGETAPLLGVPLAIKDVICTRGITTSCGSRMLENFVPPFDATAVARLRAAAVVFLGKTNTRMECTGGDFIYRRYK